MARIDRKRLRVGDSGWEVEWCVHAPCYPDDPTTLDADNCRYESRDLATKEEALAFAREASTRCVFGPVMITPFEIRRLSDEYPYGAYREHTGDPEEVDDGDLPYRHDDGGRAAAGFKGDAGDCVTRAIAIATGRPYREVYDALNALAKAERPRGRRRRSSARTGVHKPTYRRYLESLGWAWTPTMRVGSGCTVHLRAAELPPGRLIVAVSRHLVAVIDGVIHDTHDSSRGGTRCVYGYFRPVS